MITFSFYLAILLFYTDICQKVAEFDGQNKQGKKYTPIRDILIWTGPDFSKDEWTEKQNLITPFIFTETAIKKKKTYLILRGLKELFTQNWKHFIYSPSCQTQITAFQDKQKQDILRTFMLLFPHTLTVHSF